MLWPSRQQESTRSRGPSQFRRGADRSTPPPQPLPLAEGVSQRQSSHLRPQRSSALRPLETSPSDGYLSLRGRLSRRRYPSEEPPVSLYPPQHAAEDSHRHDQVPGSTRAWCGGLRGAAELAEGALAQGHSLGASDRGPWDHGRAGVGTRSKMNCSSSHPPRRLTGPDSSRHRTAGWGTP